ncbi:MULTISPECIES: YbhB/YbcL family Raf kinase inhibitor-like protein [Actinomadura]|uniref:Phospholipid-binding protein, PBP family n=2 Tax=Actinomadura madurae TaxID=1993 RepID=A0A1I4Z6T4_9ACTN|nr:YbhB/YbcL family Raf kinase inhibitor-like protein [Actinomadura madurae]MCP9949273.1 YbhB/YbcL family Raf kinase inhibitor-like protein [Actinomadura madurae]MCQ0009959.1 YbhB/YbcL family Raf kinase inhibitor-like protein [Actinomadura madurae]MCQ0014716.1 YbhB/YbcL family Raf kinase inhibitor-like protein [Actinomadura madurae]URM94850.1 YbhB/YbcL family Raf kinase inhibitor-like protein [Actinomadura madurae]URN05570.1 YbhB/YbcL family Raf kinase inhibitor-like protein [Actinomadura madu
MMSRDRRPILAAAGALALAGTVGGCGLIGQPENKSAELSEWFTVTSPVFRDGGDLPPRYGCRTYSGGQDGKTPPLRWSAPAGTKSIAIVMDDPDASSGARVHWVIAGIDGTVNEIVEGARLDKTVEGLTTGNEKAGYVPPCPPKGERHRYRFTIYALDEPAPFRNGAELKDSLPAIAEHTVGRGRITGNFGGEQAR